MRKAILPAFAIWLGLQAAASAGPPYYLGDWGWTRHCPQGDYSFLHYWTPGYYKARSFVHPSNVDQYVPAPAVPVVDQFSKQRCMPKASEPSRPYADPEGFYGRRVLPAQP